MQQAMAGRSRAGRPSSAPPSVTRHTGREPGGRPQLVQFEIEFLAKSPSRPHYTRTSSQPQPTRAETLQDCPRSPAGYRCMVRRHRGGGPHLTAGKMAATGSRSPATYTLAAPPMLTGAGASPLSRHSRYSGTSAGPDHPEPASYRGPRNPIPPGRRGCVSTGGDIIRRPKNG
jgi:hypothetical protein